MHTDDWLFAVVPWRGILARIRAALRAPPGERERLVRLIDRLLA